MFARKASLTRSFCPLTYASSYFSCERDTEKRLITIALRAECITAKIQEETLESSVGRCSSAFPFSLPSWLTSFLFYLHLQLATVLLFYSKTVIAFVCGITMSLLLVCEYLLIVSSSFSPPFLKFYMQILQIYTIYIQILQILQILIFFLHYLQLEMFD